jgi:hypothetical protein
MMQRRSLADNPIVSELASKDTRDPGRRNGVRRPENGVFDLFKYVLAVRLCMGKHP